MTLDLFGHAASLDRPAVRMGRRDHLTFRGNAALGRHGWLRLTPAYSLHLVRQLLASAGPEALVLEPFSGTGTTPLACASLGLRCDAIDINPFLVWLGNLKITRFPPETAVAVRNVAANVADRARRPNSSAWRPDIHQIEKWWDATTLNALASLFAAIEDSAPGGAGVADLLRVAFCRAMIQTANVSFGHQSMSFRRARSDAGLIEADPSAGPGRVTAQFLAAVQEIADSLDVDPPIGSCRVVLGDSRDLSAALPGGASRATRYTSVITSPPYPNRMSYIRELRPYMYWLGYLSNGRAAGELDWKAIGGTWGCATSLLNAWKPRASFGIPFRHFDQIVSQIGQRHALLGRYVHRYFEDIKSHILGLREVLAVGARCHYIVGNSKFYDTMLPVECIYAAMFADAGFTDVHIETIRKRSSKKELFEFVVHASMP